MARKAFGRAEMESPRTIYLARMAHILPLILILTNGSCVFQGCSRTDSVDGYILKGHVIAFQPEPNIWSCLQACRQTLACQSINYEIGTSKCEINNRTKNGKLYKFVSSKQYVYVENPFRARLGVTSDLPGLSCKDIKDSHENVSTGDYWIDPSRSNDPFTVFCDMHTDGGGWTLIAQTVITNFTLLTPTIKAKDYRMIRNYSSGIVRVDVPAIFQFKQLINFTQIRYFCHKKSTGRIFHIMTKRDRKGESVLSYFIEDPRVQPKACGSFQTFPDDNSTLAANCDKWGNDGHSTECDKWGYYKNKYNSRIYNDPVLWDGKHYVNFLKTSSLACDDLRHSPYRLSQGDTWQIFVR